VGNQVNIETCEDVLNTILRVTNDEYVFRWGMRANVVGGVRRGVLICMM
jgi:hypothetical protein